MKRLLIAVPVLLLGANVQAQNQVISQSLIVQGSECVGVDCTSTESFGFDTIRLKENNLRIRFDDTSTAASFPRNDWQLTANESANGGLAKFSIDDITGGRTPFTVEAGAPSHSLYVEDSGDVGFGTNTPVVELHATGGDTPTLRLEQNTSSGFAAQTWDVAGNETNFFVRDVTGGSALPFRIEPGTASNTLFLDSQERVGIGTSAPDEKLHLADTTDSRVGIELQNNTSTTDNFQIVYDNTELRLSRQNSGVIEMQIQSGGNVQIAGNLVTGGGGTCDPGPCDAVFDPEIYTVPSIEEHAAQMWENKHLPAVGPTKPGEPVNVTTKLTRMLNELEHAHIYIERLHRRIEVLEDALDEKG